MNFKTKAILGKTGLKVGPLGISSSFGATADVYEEAFDFGCNYFTWGTFIKGDSHEMKIAIRNLINQGKRDELVIAVYTYAHNTFLTEYFLRRRLKILGIDHVDVLILGYYSNPPSERILNGAKKLKQKGMVRCLGISSHSREMFKEIIPENEIDVFHIRYNAANRGAEKDVFPYLSLSDRPGIVTYTATRWGRLLNPKKMPEGENPLTAADCYRFVLSNPMVDVCMMGVKNINELRGNMAILEIGTMNEQELQHVSRIGKYVYEH